MTRTLVFAVVGIAVALAWWTWRSDEPQLPASAGDDAYAPSTAPRAAAAPSPEATVRTIGLDGAFLAGSLTNPEALVAGANDEDSRAGVLRGRLTVREQPWVHPAGVEVRLTRSWLDSVVPVESDPAVRAPERDEVRTETDEHGRFAFRIVPPATELFFLIGHRTDWQDYQKVAKLPRAGETVDLGDVWLDQRGEIVGRCTMYGQPIAGAIVRAVDDPLLDGTSGFEEVHAARNDAAASFRVPGTTTGGTVPGWVVRRDQFLPFPTATTDRTGAFRLTGVRPGNHNLFVVAAGSSGAAGRSDGVLVAPALTTDIGTLALRATSHHVHLRFVDEHNRPWSGAHIAQLHEPMGFGATALRTDPDGSVHLPILSGTRGELLFAFPNGAPWLPVAWPSAPMTTLLGGGAPPIRVPRPAPLDVRLVDQSGGAIAGGTVRTFTAVDAFRIVDRQLPESMQPRETAPGAHTGALPTAAIVVAHAPGFAPGVARATPGEGPIELVLMRLQTFDVRVHDLQGRPIVGAAVRAQVHDNPDLVFAGAQWQALANGRVLLGRTDEQGLLTVSLWPTWFTFRASHPDYGPTPSPKLQPRAGERIDVLLLGRADVHGTLTIETRAAPAGLRVRARQAPPPEHVLADCGWLDERIAVTGDGGTFAFRQLAAGTWELAPETPAIGGARGPLAAPQPEWRAQRIHLDHGQELHVTLEIQHDQLQPVQLEGTVTRNGLTVPGALVRVRPLDRRVGEASGWREGARRAAGRAHGKRRPDLDAELAELLEPTPRIAWQRCETDAFGTFRFRALDAGDHELRVDVPQNGRLQFVHRRVVRPGSMTQPARADVALATGEARIGCSRDGRPFGMRMLRLRQIVEGDVEGARLEVLLDRDGQAWIEHVPIGTWTVEPMHGGRCDPGEFTVAAGATAMPLLTVSGR